MKKISIQFHALPSEMVDLIGDLSCEKNIFMVEAIGSPLRFQEWKMTGEDFHEKERRAFAFTFKEPVLNVASIDQFRRLNPDALTLEIGQISSAGLSESWLSAMTDNAQVMACWQAGVKRLQAATLTGAVAVNPSSGATAPMKWHRFTKQAQRAFENGLAMLPAAGNSIVKLPPIS